MYSCGSKCNAGLNKDAVVVNEDADIETGKIIDGNTVTSLNVDVKMLVGAWTVDAMMIGERDIETGEINEGDSLITTCRCQRVGGCIH